MRLRKLYLKAFGPFTDRVLDFGTKPQGLILVYGPNEAGKSSTLRAVSDLRFGIPQHSTDNFVHDHGNMRIGGEFLDRDGTTHSFMRRKGRGITLHRVDFSVDPVGPGEPVPPETEALLTCGIRREAYESMFGLNHNRLREGGRALLSGEGDVGAALFEASSGARDIPLILEHLDASARKFFIPGSRAKNAAINEGLRAYEEGHSAFRNALVRPAKWADLSKKHEAAKTQLSELEARRTEISRKLLEISELRAVLPLLSGLDAALQAQEDLKAAPLLTETAAAERLAAQSGLSAAQDSAAALDHTIQEQKRKLEQLSPDSALLSVAAAVDRLYASAEHIDTFRREIAAANGEVASLTEQLAASAARLDPSLPLEAVLGRIPSKASRQTIDELLRSCELAEGALAEHRNSVASTDEAENAPTPHLPSIESRTALRIAQSEVSQFDADLKRLSHLPGELKAAQRLVATELRDLRIADEAALNDVRPLLDSQIDAALHDVSSRTTTRANLDTRIQEISRALLEAASERDQLIAEGAAATFGDVASARSHRDSAWGLVRATYIEAKPVAVSDFTGGAPLPQVYETAVTEADRVVDLFANDTERGAKLQEQHRHIDALESDRAALIREVADIDLAAQSALALWRESLIAAKLPALSPAELREWQGRLPKARKAIESLQQKTDELDRIRAGELELAGRLRIALIGTGLANPAEDASLSTLSAIAADVDATTKRLEAEINKASGTQTERERNRQQFATRQSELNTELNAARNALTPFLKDLLLPEDAGISVVRARLTEFDDLSLLNTRHLDAEASKRQSEGSLTILTGMAHSIQNSLGDPSPPDIRLYVDQLHERLATARDTERQRELVTQALEQSLETHRSHLDTAAKHQRALDTLCVAAGIASATDLPEVEEQSRRKRSALAELDRTRTQLAEASRRSVHDLRALLASQDTAGLDSDERSLSEEQLQVEAQLRSTRQLEENTRRALEAIDSSDVASEARESMERAAATVRANMPLWIRSKLAYALLFEALKRFRERAQGPMLAAASRYFERMTDGNFVELLSDEEDSTPILIAERSNGSQIHIDAMSEGTLDQLYLALRLAAIDMRRESGVDLPLILDDVLMTSDEDRSGSSLKALAEFAKGNQVIVFSHHRYVAEEARKQVPEERLTVVTL